MKKFLLALMGLMVSVSFTIAQRTISGTVTDDGGEPLIGANVLVQGTTSGTITDFDGKYQLSVPDGSNVLVFSYTGYATQEVELGASNIVDLTMSEGVLLDQAVVTALGISRDKKSLGYATQEVGAEEFNNAQQTDIISSLAGRLSGIDMKQSSNIGGSKRVVIRGASSFFGENQPLIVLDGLPIDNSNYNSSATQGGNGGTDYGNMLNDLNPDDIESVNVLKGAGAALYGSRAANGVIVITTKKGKMGSNDFKIDVSSSLNFENAYIMPEIQQKYGGGAIISDADGGQDGFEVANIEGKDYKIVQYGIDESWGPKFDPNISVLHWDAFDKTSYPDQYLKERPWTAPAAGVRDFFETGTQYVNSIALTKSGENFATRFGYTNTTGVGVLPGSSMDKNSFSLSGQSKLWDKLVVDAQLNFVRSETVGRPLLGYPASNQSYGNTYGQTLWQWFQTNVDYDRQKDYLNLDGSQRSWNRNAWDDATPHYSDNYYWIAHQNFSDDERDRLIGNIGLSYELMDGLTIGGRMSRDNYTFYNRERVAAGSQAQSWYYEAVRNSYENNLEGTITYDTDISDAISLKVLAGGNQMRNRYHFNRGETSGGLVVAGLYNLLNSAGAPLLNDITEVEKINSLFGSVSLGINNSLYLEATARNDWSSTLPTDNNSYFYPSVSASYVFSELLNSDFINFGKLRVGWAKIAKGTDPYKVLSIYNFNTDGGFGGNPRLYAPKDLLNANLKPEVTTTYEIGLETRMMKDRIGLDITYFNNVTNDQIIPLELSKSTGYDSKFINAGEILNKGIEATLRLTPVKTDNFSWDIAVNYTKTNNEVVEIVDGIEAMDIARAPFSGVILRASVGETYGQLWGTDYIYDDNGNKVVGDNGYWLRTPNLVPLGAVTPDYNVGISSGINYKNIDFGFLFDIQKGGKFYSLSHQWGHYAGTWAETAGVNDQGNEIRDPISEGGGIKLDGVTADVEFDDDGNYTVTNAVANEKYVTGRGWAARHYHGFGYPSAQSVFNADYVKLREVTLGYTFDMKGKTVNSLKITAYGRNVWTFGLDHPGLDPEITVNGSGNIQGIEGGFLPTTRSFGLKVQFGL